MLDDLKAQYLQSLHDRINTIKTLVRDYRSGDTEIDQKIRTLAHFLHGSGATFGFPEISAAAKEVEHAPEKELIRKLTHLVKVLKEAPTKPVEVVSADTFRILLIDDDPEIARVIVDALSRKSASYQVIVAETAAGGEEQLVKNEFALILLGLVLPDRDGRDILRDLKIEFKLPTPVFVLSAIDRDTVRVECMSLGADKFFLKPFDPDAVALAVDKLLRNDRRELSMVPMEGEGQPQSPAPAPAANATEFAGKTVLVVGDDNMQAANIKQRLIREGFAVDVVENGKLAIDMLQKKAYALAILDVRMPVMDGFQVLGCIRDEMKLGELPVILLTAMGSEGDIIKGYDLGADDYILKPFSLIQLIARVKSLLKKR